MLLERARVVAMDADTVWVVPESGTACSACATEGGCGLLTLARFRRARRLPITRVAGMPVTVGSRVLIGIHEGQFLDAVVRSLLPPLGAMLFAALGAELWLGWSEIATVAAAAVGLGGGFFWVRYRASGSRQRMPQPALLECLAPGRSDNSRLSP